MIAALQSDPGRYGQHTAAIVDELVRIERGDDVSARATALLQDVEAWVELGEVDPSVLAMLEPILAPLESSAGDGNGNGRQD